MIAVPNPVRTQAADSPARRYGVVPWRLSRRSALRILLVAGPDGSGWTVPARPPVAGGAPFVTAALAAFEEAGIIGDIDTVPLATTDGELVLFAMNVRGTLSHWKGKDTRRRGWFSPADAAGRIGDPAAATVVQALAARPEMLTPI